MPSIFVRALGIIYVIIIVILSIAVKINKAKKNCKNGWFGEDCRYLCHCENNQPCEKDGRCRNRCAETYMGEACQNVIVARWEAEHTVAEGTQFACPTHTTKEVLIKLNKPQVVTWARVWTNAETPTTDPGFTVQVNSGDNCSRPVVERTHTGEMDVFCPNIRERVTTLWFAGDGIIYWCKVLVAGGRNLAIRQTVLVIPRHSTDYLPKNLVDGKRPSESLPSSKACVHTTFPKDPDERGNVTVIFRTPVDAYKFNIYARPEVLDRQIDLTINIFNAEDILIFSETLKEGKMHWDLIPVTIVQNIKRISFSRPPKRSRTLKEDGILNFCELEVLGACPFNVQGIGCDFPSKPASPGDFCSPTSGCPGPCGTGKFGSFCNITCPELQYGGNCSLQCSKHCANETCDAENGTCHFGCLNEAYPPLCTMKSAVEESFFRVNLLSTMVAMIGTVLFISIATSLVRKKENRPVAGGREAEESRGIGGEERESQFSKSPSMSFSKSSTWSQLTSLDQESDEFDDYDEDEDEEDDGEEETY